MITVKKIETDLPNQENYQIIGDVKDQAGIVVGQGVIGNTNLEVLERQKLQGQAIIDEAQAKIDAINTEVAKEIK